MATATATELDWVVLLEKVKVVPMVVS